MPTSVVVKNQSAMAATLLAKAEAVAANAYAPYSRFRVGAALLAQSGRIYVGCNFENISYPLGTCAEEAVIAAARAVEGVNFNIIGIAIFAKKDGGDHVGCAPCGGCRQRIVEVNPNTTVIFYDSNLQVVEMSASEMLPAAFTF
jgi:cytidine deaminase